MRPPADELKMTRGLGLVSLVITLVVSAMLFSSQLSNSGAKPASPKQNPVVQQASSVAAESAAMQAEHELAAYQADEGTFVGASVTDIPGVTLLDTGPTTFCLQIASGGGVIYDAGPGGTPSPNRC
jgi:Na+-transporting methylmalonyl-CoA/oxaloacetate decarboxylase gamma subunit